MSVSNDLAAYAAHMQAEGLRPKTIRSYGAYLKRFARWLGEQGLDDLDAATAEAFLIDISVTRDYRTQTYNQAYFAIRRLLRWHHRDPELTLGLSPRPRKARARRYLSPEKVQRLLLAVEDARHRCALRLMYGVGLRVQEVTQVHNADIAGGESVLVVRDGKGGHARRVPLSGSVLAMLRVHWRRWRPDPLLFPADPRHPQRPVAVGTLQRAFNCAWEHCRLARETGCATHILRHSFARHQLQAGLDIRDLQRILGHQSIATTMVYLSDLDIDGHDHPRVFDLQSGWDDRQEAGHAPA